MHWMLPIANQREEDNCVEEGRVSSSPQRNTCQAASKVWNLMPGCRCAVVYLTSPTLSDRTCTKATPAVPDPFHTHPTEINDQLLWPDLFHLQPCISATSPQIKSAIFVQVELHNRRLSSVPVWSQTGMLSEYEALNTSPPLVQLQYSAGIYLLFCMLVVASGIPHKWYQVREQTVKLSISGFNTL